MYGAFYGCTKITTVNIGEDVEFIGEKAFYGCSALTSVYFAADESWTLSLSGATTPMTVTVGTNYRDYIMNNYNYEWTLNVAEEE